MRGWPTTPSCSNAKDVLARLLEAVADAANGDGALLLVTGEAGIGKTALLHRLVDDSGDDVRVWSGACERLFTPRPLGPLADMVAVLPADVGAAVRRGAAVHDILPLLLDELGRAPTLVVIEDVHWADEATLDLIALLGRRVRSTPRARRGVVPRRRARIRPPAARRPRQPGGGGGRARPVGAAEPGCGGRAGRSPLGRRRAAAAGIGWQPVLRDRGAGGRWRGAAPFGPRCRHRSRRRPRPRCPHASSRTCR